jgi:hypothetical protein
LKDQVVAATENCAVLVEPDTITAFKACDAVIAYDDVPAN